MSRKHHDSVIDGDLAIFLDKVGTDETVCRFWIGDFPQQNKKPKSHFIKNLLQIPCLSLYIHHFTLALIIDCFHVIT